MATIVDTTALGKVILYSVLSGVGTAAIFGLCVSSAAGLLEALRRGRTVASLLWGALAVACLAGGAAIAVLGIVVLSSKS